MSDSKGTDLNLWVIPLREAFDLGEVQDLAQITSGLLQETWRLQTHKGTFIAQKLHPVFSESVTIDGQIVSSYLRSQGLPTPEYRVTREDSLHLHLQEDRWRVMTCLPGITHRVPPSLEHLHHVGRIVGRMHRALASLDYSFRFQLPHFHDTPFLWQTAQTLPLPPDLEPEAQFLIQTIPELFLPDHLPHQIIHGDLKLQNFLFDSEARVCGILDFDTLMRHSLYVELGDALRSWTKHKGAFNIDFLKAGLTGYEQTGMLAGLDPDLILRGLKLITLELALRFLIDVVEDRYFAWDPDHFPDRPSHNRARCRQQIAFYRQIKRQEGEIHMALRHL